MNHRKTVLSVAMAAALGTTGMMVSTFASAALVSDGNYVLNINPNPSGSTTSSVAGSDGAWNSTFSFNKVKPTVTSQPMTDNSTMITTAGGLRGSSVGGDGAAGKLNLTVTGGTFTIDGAYQIDTIYATAGGNFAQYGTSAGGGGTIDQTSGAVTLTPTGRLGAIDGGGGTLFDKRWNVDNSAALSTNTAWETFTTGTVTTYGGTATGSVTGATLTSLGDINADGITDWRVILVSAAKVGADWGPGFAGQGYIETWNANLISAGGATPPPAPVPVPAAVWLLGSGLVGLVGVARRKKAAA